MIDKEKIIAEIERLKADYVPNVNTEYRDFAKLLLDIVVDSINSLPAAEEQPSEDLEAEIDRYFKDDKWFSTPLGDIARHFAQWQNEQIMKGLCYETKVYRDEEGDGIDTPIESWLALENNEITNLPNIGLKDGDKVKVIIVKEDEQ